MEFVLIPSGLAIIGTSLAGVHSCVREWSDNLVDPSYSLKIFRSWILKEYPQHQVAMDSFFMARFPVTNSEYREFLLAMHSDVPASIQQEQPNDWPVWGVSYASCCTFAAWTGQRLKRRVRLPTEFEWEYAARGPENNEYPFGNTFSSQACNTLEAAIHHPTSVIQYSAFPSGFGICDMAGNVEEWTSSLYIPYEGGSKIRDEISDACGLEYRVLRGGSFTRNGDLARCARRHGPHPGGAFKYRGFRLASDD